MNADLIKPLDLTISLQFTRSLQDLIKPLDLTISLQEIQKLEEHFKQPYLIQP